LRQFNCNICGAACAAETLDRECSTCQECGSNVRLRWIVHALSVELFGQSIRLADFRVRKDVRGIGMSDPVRIAEPLANLFDYKNTCLHREPHLDIMDPPAMEPLDFIITSEVFEHVRPPVQLAFNNLRRLLKPGGFVIFTTPWGGDGDTAEHFPNLYDWRLVRLSSGYVVLNRTTEGKLETFDDLVFHGGPGSVLEMRIFSKKGLLANCAASGFTRVTFAEDYAEFGIEWIEWSSRGIILRA
jgi:SAM-dependent methyltransferase